MQKRHSIYFITLALLLAYFVGCASVKQYSGPDLPNDKVARIIGVEGIEIFGIDGEKYFIGPREIRILPGEHTLLVRYYEYGKGRGRPILLKLNTEAGHVYQIKKEIHLSRTRWKAWIIDKETNEIVSKRAR